jgi:hypothetical protein
MDFHFNQRPFFHQFTSGTPAFERFRKAWTVLDAILKVPYWDRIWIVQENILPPSATVVLGSISMAWYHFSDAAKVLMKHWMTCCHFETTKMLAETVNTITLFNRVVLGLDQLREFKQHDDPPPDLQDLLPRFFSRKATDPRDKVHGIMSLIHGWSSEIWKDFDATLVSDYSPANSPRMLFLNVTRYLFEETKSLEILTGDCRRRHEPGYPSWIVDWGLDPDVERWDSDKLRMHMYKYYNAAKDLAFVAEILSNERLKVQGTLIDEVSHVGRYISSSQWDDSFPTLDAVLLLAGKKRQAADEYKGGGTWREAHWRTICGNLLYEDGLDGEFRKSTAADTFTWERYQAAYDHIHGNMRSLKTKEDEELLNKMVTVVGALVDRRVFVTKEGYLGLGPENTQVGDQVFILGGSNVPFILRSVQNNMMGKSKAGHRIIGDCYIHGIMDGEICRSPRHGEATILILH